MRHSFFRRSVACLVLGLQLGCYTTRPLLDATPQPESQVIAQLTDQGTVDMADYTLQADVKVGQKVIAGERQMPDPGIINSRYVLVLLGNHQRVQIHAWPRRCRIA